MVFSEHDSDFYALDSQVVETVLCFLPSPSLSSMPVPIVCIVKLITQMALFLYIVT